MSAPLLDQSDWLAVVLRDAEPLLRRLAQRLCSGSVDAGDLVQDTFERALRRGIPRDLRNPRAWLVTIMHHLFIDRCRAAVRHPVAPEDFAEERGDVAPAPDVDEPDWTQITVDDARNALEHVEPAYRDVYRMHAFEHLSHEQIAQQLSISRLTVASRLHRARRRLREVLVKRFGLEQR